MNTLLEILSPDFLLRNAVYTNLLVGLACPFIGIFIIMRRLVFVGVALPQISATGVAVALSAHVLLGHDSPIHHTNEQTLAFSGSILFTLAAVVTLALLQRRGALLTEGRLGAAYALTTALSILVLAKCPQAERGWLAMLKGEIIGVTPADLWLSAGAFSVVLVLLAIYYKEILLVSADRDMALSLGKSIFGWDLLFYLLLGATISVAVLTVGPLIAFGFLLFPPLIARVFARNMRQLAMGASFVGGLGALLGFYLAYRWDLPVGPTDVALLGGLYAVALLIRFFCRQN